MITLLTIVLAIAVHRIIVLCLRLDATEAALFRVKSDREATTAANARTAELLARCGTDDEPAHLPRAVTPFDRGLLNEAALWSSDGLTRGGPLPEMTETHGVLMRGMK